MSAEPYRANSLPRDRRPAAPRPTAAWLIAALFAFLLVALAPPAAAQTAPTPTAPGWRLLELDAGNYALRYRPASAALPAPTVLFLHGAGGRPEPYRPSVAAAAEAAGVVVLLPAATTDLGWGWGDDNAVIVAALEASEADGVSDLDRLTVAGHSAGGAYAYLLTYVAGLPARAVFTLASPFYPVAGPLAAPVPPIRMYYGHQDPNYQGGSFQRLADQWDRLGVAWEADLAPGHGHGSWPQGSMDAGFAFLATHSGAGTGGGGGGGGGDTCVPSDTVLCLRDGRYRVEVEWQDFQGNVGAGHVVDGIDAAGGASGLFWFFRPGNWELMVKVLDGCAIDGHVWVFSAATTNVAYTLHVTDTERDREWRHDNVSGRPAPAVTDTRAFACAE